MKLDGVTIVSHRTVVNNKLNNCILDAMKEMEKESIEWVQEQMLYGYHDPHGKDGHTEIYDTGFMAEQSLRSEAKRDSQNAYTLSVGSTASYAKYVHNGTHKLKARPFLTDALEKNKGKQKEIYEKHLKKMT